MRKQDIIDRISESLSGIENVEVFLYGSQARGDAGLNSDIDLLILLPDSLNVRERINMELLIHSILLPIEDECDIEISPLILQKKVWNSRKTPFTINVTNDRIRI